MGALGGVGLRGRGWRLLPGPQCVGQQAGCPWLSPPPRRGRASSSAPTREGALSAGGARLCWVGGVSRPASLAPPHPAGCPDFPVVWGEGRLAPHTCAPTWGGAHHRLRSAQGPREVRDGPRLPQPPESPLLTPPAPRQGPAADTQRWPPARSREHSPDAGLPCQGPVHPESASHGTAPAQRPGAGRACGGGPVPAPPPRMGVRSPQTRLPCRPLVTLGTPGDTRPGGPVAPRPEDTETQCWRSTRAQALPPAHVLSTPPRLGWTSQAGARRSQGTEVRPPQAGKSQLQDSAQRGHPGGAHEAPSRAVTVIFGKRGCSPYSSCGVGPSARARLPLCPSSWPGWG